MKKVILLIISLLSIFSFNNKTFDIDIAKVSVNGINDDLIGELDSSYSIDIEGFKKSNVTSSEVKSISKEILNIVVSDGNKSDKQKKLVSYMLFSSSNGFDTLTGNMFISSFLDGIDGKKISYDEIKAIRAVSFNDNDIISYVYLPNASYDGEIKDIILGLWLKEEKGEYKLYFPWLTVEDDLDSYFEKISSNESNGNNIGDSFKKLSLSGDSYTNVSDDVLQKLYDDNVLENVEITAMSQNGISAYGSGFFIRKGIVVTTWSNLVGYLSNGNYVYVNDSEGKTYNVVGVVAANATYDVVVLKLDQETGESVSFNSSSTLKTDDNLFMINSKNNKNFSISYGSFIKEENGKMSNLLALTSSDVGSALYDKNGAVVGFTTGDAVNSELSYANSIDYLIDLQKKLVNEEFNSIKYTDLNLFKDKYYNSLSEEKSVNNISDDVWNKFKKIGNLESITLPLVKASYVDGIVSLRYKNDISNSIDGMYFINDFVSNLESSSYKLSYSTLNKKIYDSDKYRVIIKEEMDYLIILIMER